MPLPNPNFAQSCFNFDQFCLMAVSIYYLHYSFNPTTKPQFCFNLVQFCFNLVQWLFQSFSPAVSIFFKSFNSFDSAPPSPDCSGNPLCPPRKRGWSEKQVGNLLAWKKVAAPKKKRFIGRAPAFLSAKNPIFAFIRNNAQSGISKYSSRSQ